jgi:nitroreductase
MDALDAIRLRRSVRRDTDRPVPDAEVDRLLRLALLAPTGHNAQAWSFVVVRGPERRARLAELVLRGAAEYFRRVGPARDRTPEEHAAWARGYASIAFALENLFVAARDRGLGTTPTIFHWFAEEEYRELLGIPPAHRAHYLTPLGYPEAFPVGLRPDVARARRPWRTLVHDEVWGNPRMPEPVPA